MKITGMCYSGNRRCILIVHKIADTVLRTTQISTTQIKKLSSPLSTYLPRRYEAITADNQLQTTVIVGLVLVLWDMNTPFDSTSRLSTAGYYQNRAKGVDQKTGRSHVRGVYHTLFVLVIK
jgi:hypothetical protein